MNAIRSTLARSIIYVIFILTAASCYVSKKMDQKVADFYGGQLPKPDKKKKADFTVQSDLPFAYTGISKTIKKSKVLPLIIFWHFDFRRTCYINPQIAVTNLSNTINKEASKGLVQKLNGGRLELTVEQVPEHFAIVQKGNIALFIHWERTYVEQDHKDLVVSYKYFAPDSSTKTGTISIPSIEKNKNVWFFQSWKSAAAETIARYNNDITTMSKAFVGKLLQEL
jgi:hypothetical protein